MVVVVAGGGGGGGGSGGSGGGGGPSLPAHHHSRQKGSYKLQLMLRPPPWRNWLEDWTSPGVPRKGRNSGVHMVSFNSTPVL